MKSLYRVALSVASIFSLHAGVPINHTLNVHNSSDQVLTVIMKRSGTILSSVTVQPKTYKPSLFENELKPNDEILVSLPNGQEIFSHTIKEGSDKFIDLLVNESLQASIEALPKPRPIWPV